MYPFGENAFAVHFCIQVLKLHPRATSGIVVLPPNGRMHVLQGSGVYHFRRFSAVSSILYTRMHQKTVLLVYTRQETDCTYWKKPYTVHRRGEVLFPLFVCKVLPKKALFHSFHVISAMPFTPIRYPLIPSVRGSHPRKT